MKQVRANETCCQCITLRKFPQSLRVGAIMVSLLHSPWLIASQNLGSSLISQTLKPRNRGYRALFISSSSKDNNDFDSSPKSTRFVTFLGKGGSGKTTAAVLAAQYYAKSGFSTCLVVHNQDPTADYLLGQKIGTSPTSFDTNLAALRLETTKMLLQPLNRVKEADSRLNMSQGVLEGIVGEELGVLPGMDSIFSLLELERLVGFMRNDAGKVRQKEKFDVIIYDGISTEETLRMIGIASKARLYLKYLRSLTEKTDMGRLAGPSIMRLVDEAMSISGTKSPLNGTTSAEIWEMLERFLEKGASFVTEPSKFGCFLVMDPNNKFSVDSALRYWGCTVQAGAYVSGAFAPTQESSNKDLEKIFSPLPVAFVSLPNTKTDIDWNGMISNKKSEDARNLLSQTVSHGYRFTPTVEFNAAKRSVTLFMPGFDKSEIRLYQYRGGSELLVEAGDQRRVIRLPSQIQGKVGGAKFMDRSLVITMR